jgi:hypothetical protein
MVTEQDNPPPFDTTPMGKKIVSTANFVRELIRSEPTATLPTINGWILMRSLNEKGRMTDILLMLMNQSLITLDVPTESILAAMAGWEAGGVAPSLSDLRTLASLPRTPIANQRAGLGSPAHGLGINTNPDRAAEQPVNPALMSSQSCTYLIFSPLSASRKH